MEQDVIKIKIIDTIRNKSTIVELSDLQTVPEDIKIIIRTIFTKSQLIFIGDSNSMFIVQNHFKIAKAVQAIVGQSLEWRITDKIPNSMDLGAYLVLRG